MKSTAYLLACLSIGIWSGGLVALGGIAAPVVFRIVPAPYSADAMTVVFRRFDKVALVCVLVLAIAEMMRVVVSTLRTRLDFARITIELLAAALAFWEAYRVSPTIDELHRAGAIRHFGPLGVKLEHFHKFAEFSAKAQLLLLFVALVLWVGSRSREQSD